MKALRFLSFGAGLFQANVVRPATLQDPAHIFRLLTCGTLAA
jgi:hypothetical protein